MFSVVITSRVPITYRGMDVVSIDCYPRRFKQNKIWHMRALRSRGHGLPLCWDSDYSWILTRSMTAIISVKIQPNTPIFYVYEVPGPTTDARCLHWHHSCKVSLLGWASSFSALSSSMTPLVRRPYWNLQEEAILPRILMNAVTIWTVRQSLTDVQGTTHSRTNISRVFFELTLMFRRRLFI